MVLHQPVKKHVFKVRATYQREAEKVIAHLASMSIARVALVCPDDSFGTDGLASAKKGLTAAKLMPVATEKFDRAKPDFSPLALRIHQANALAVVMVATAQAVGEGVKALRAAGSTAQIVTMSNNASSGFVKILGDNARGMSVTQVFPSERSINYAMVREAQELLKASSKVPPELSRKKIPTALEGMRKFDLGGL